MRIPALVLPLLAASCASVGRPASWQGAADDEPASQVAVLGGLRSLDGSDWSPVDAQGVLGFEYAREAPGSAVGFEIGLYASERTEDDFRIPPMAVVDVVGRTTELSVGLRKSVRADFEGVHPYVGCGLSLLHAELESESGGLPAHDEDDSGGIYVRGGVAFDLSRTFFLGLDLRARFGSELEILGDDLSASYGQVAVVLGARF